MSTVMFLLNNIWIANNKGSCFSIYLTSFCKSSTYIYVFIESTSLPSICYINCAWLSCKSQACAYPFLEKIKIVIINWLTRKNLWVFIIFLSSFLLISLLLLIWFHALFSMWDFIWDNNMCVLDICRRTWQDIRFLHFWVYHPIYKEIWDD